MRFDCEEPDQRPLRVVTREEEIASRGANNRGVNWLDRRESFGGPDWGDHVEIQLAPGLDGTDPFHNGYYLILVNSHGDVLSRYFDPCGAYSVDVESWRPGARSQTEIHSGRWTIQVAVPWSSFFGLEAAGTSGSPTSYVTGRGKRARRLTPGPCPMAQHANRAALDA